VGRRLFYAFKVVESRVCKTALCSTPQATALRSARTDIKIMECRREGGTQVVLGPSALLRPDCTAIPCTPGRFRLGVHALDPVLALLRSGVKHGAGLPTKRTQHRRKGQYGHQNDPHESLMPQKTITRSSLRCGTLMDFLRFAATTNCLHTY